MKFFRPRYVSWEKPLSPKEKPVDGKADYVFVWEAKMFVSFSSSLKTF